MRPHPNFMPLKMLFDPALLLGAPLSPRKTMIVSLNMPLEVRLAVRLCSMLSTTEIIPF